MPAAEDSSTAEGAGFQCAVCLDTPTDPVVTKCGHMFCWPCLDRWLNGGESAQGPCCPKCRGALDPTKQGEIIPVYGPGRSSSPSSRSAGTTSSGAGDSSRSDADNATAAPRPTANREEPPPPQAGAGGWIPRRGRVFPFLFLSFGFQSGAIAGAIPLLLLLWYMVPERYTRHIGWGRTILIFLAAIIALTMLTGESSMRMGSREADHTSTYSFGAGSNYGSGDGGGSGGHTHKLHRAPGGTGRR